MVGFKHNIEYLGRELVVWTDSDPFREQEGSDNFSYSMVRVEYLGRRVEGLVSGAGVVKALEWTKIKN